MRILLVIASLVAVPGPARAQKAEAWPKAVTQAWLGEVARGKWPLSTLVEAPQGLVVLERVVDSDSDDRDVVSARRLCGEPLARALPALERRVIAALGKSDVTGCRNRPGPPRCVFGVAHEHTVMTYLVFRTLDSGDLVLDAVLFLDGGMQDDAFREQQNRWVRTRMIKLRQTDCAGKPTPLPGRYQKLQVVQL